MKLTILQWNVWYQERADNILEFLRQTDADVLCLQELTADSFINPGRNLPAEIATLGYDQHYVVTLERSGHDHTRMGNAIFSKFPVSARHAVYIQQASDQPEVIDKENRVYIESDIMAANTQLTIGTTHMAHTRGFIETPYKTRETDLLLKALEHQTTQFIFTCDSNALPESTTMQRLATHLRHAGPPFAEKTWTTKRHDFPSITIDGLNWRLDYVFATPDLQVSDSRILPTNYSDHLPILTTITL